MKKYNLKKTFFLTKEDAEKDLNWFVFDAKGKTLGRFASEIAKILRGKHKTTFTPHNDCGDGVVIINAKQVAVTGSKEARKTYTKYTGHIGGLRETPFSVMRDRNPEQIIRLAVKGMMPKTRLGNAQLKRLRIFAGSEHNMQAQQPQEIS